jgi:hypothetical protein
MTAAAAAAAAAAAIPWTGACPWYLLEESTDQEFRMADHRWRNNRVGSGTIYMQHAGKNFFVCWLYCSSSHHAYAGKMMSCTRHVCPSRHCLTDAFALGVHFLC